MVFWLNSFVVLLCLSVTVISGNYLLDSHHDALLVKSYYDEEVDYYRESLTENFQDFSKLFIDMIADIQAEATTPAQGAQIQNCAEIAANSSTVSIPLLNNYINVTEDIANSLHVSVIDQLQVVNIWEVGPEQFYQIHFRRMQVAIDDLFYIHALDMSSAMWYVYFDLLNITFDFESCLNLEE